MRQVDAATNMGHCHFYVFQWGRLTKSKACTLSHIVYMLTQTHMTLFGGHWIGWSVGDSDIVVVRRGPCVNGVDVIFPDDGTQGFLTY